MSSDPPASPRNPLWHTAKEYLTHWFVAGVIVTLTGFTPDHWVANVFHAVKLDSLRGVFSEYQFLAVYIGVTFLIVDAVVRNRGRQFEPAAVAEASGLVAASADAPVLQIIEDKPSIAVLPFVNMSKDPDQEYFADGMTEDIITGLSCDSRLFVIARNSTFVYKGQPVDIRAVGKELGVRYVVEGSIRPAGDRLRITVQLIDAASGAHVWAEKIDRPIAEIFDIMDDVVDGLVTSLCSSLGMAEGKRAARARPEDLQAWALCVQAETTYYSQPSGESLLAAENLTRRATEIEPGYGPGWALLARQLCLKQILGVRTDGLRDVEQAVSFANQALGLASNDPVVLGYCGFVLVQTGQVMRGIEYLEKSLALNPNSGLVRLWYGQALSMDGRAEAAIAQLDMFMRHSPKDPSAWLAYMAYGGSHLLLDDPQRAEQFARRGVNVAANHPGLHLLLACSLAALGRLDEAQQSIRIMRQLAPDWTLQGIEKFWRFTYRRPEDAEKLIALTRQAWVE